uniref:Uncharacterized protein n=1 Tax=Anopheles coluzzii TaxID=1518534 RepID=A0A8W7PXX3_ANOCL
MERRFWLIEHGPRFVGIYSPSPSLIEPDERLSLDDWPRGAGVGLPLPPSSLLRDIGEGFRIGLLAIPVPEEEDDLGPNGGMGEVLISLKPPLRPDGPRESVSYWTIVLPVVGDFAFGPIISFSSVVEVDMLVGRLETAFCINSSISKSSRGVTAPRNATPASCPVSNWRCCCCGISSSFMSASEMLISGEVFSCCCCCCCTTAGSMSSKLASNLASSSSSRSSNEDDSMRAIGAAGFSNRSSTSMMSRRAA